MKKLFTLFAAIVAAVAMNATALYTLDTSISDNQGSGNAYANANTATVNGIGWSVEGNLKMSPWRIGGKGDVVRHAKTTTAFAQPVASIQLTLGSANAKLNSVKFMHSTSADFAGAQEITVNIVASSSAVIAVDGGFPANSYFQFIFDESCSASTNQYVEFSKVEFLNDVPVVTQPDTITGTIGEINAMQAEELNTFDYFHTTGVISSIENPQYGNIHIADDIDTVMIYGTNDFAALELEIGDTIEVIGKMKLYNETLEFVNVDVLDVKRGGQGGDKVELEFTSGTGDINGSVIDILLEGDNISVLYETSFSNKSIVGTYTDAKEENIVLTIDAAEFLEMPVTEGTFKITFVSVDESYNYTYTATINLKGVDGITYTGETTFTVNGDLENDNTNIDAAMAAQLCSQLASGSTCETTYDIYGYVSVLKADNNKGNKVFYIADNATSTEQVFYCYGVTWTGAAPAVHDMVHVRAQLKNYNGTLETNYGDGEVVTSFPVLRHGQPIVVDTIDVDVAGAMAVGNALADNATTTDVYRVTGYAVKLQKDGYNVEGGYQTVYMSDDVTATSGEFQAYKCNVAAPGVALGDQVVVTGKITKYVSEGYDPAIEIKSGDMEVISSTGVQELLQSAKSSKALLNGKLVIIKNGKAYNAQGMRL